MTDSQTQEHETIDRLTQLPRELKNEIFIVLDNKSRAMLTRVNRHFADRNSYPELKCPADFWSLTTPVERLDFIRFLWIEAIFTCGRRLMPCTYCRTWHPANEIQDVVPHRVAFILHANSAYEFEESCVACALVRRAFFKNGRNPTVMLVPTKTPCSMQNEKLEAYFCKLCNKFARIDWCNKCRMCKACVENIQEAATANQPASSKTHSTDDDSECSGQRPTCHHYWVGFKLVTNAPQTRHALSARGSLRGGEIVTVPFEYGFAMEDDGELYITPRSLTSDDGGDPHHEERNVDYHEEGNRNHEEYDDGYQDEGNDRQDHYHDDDDDGEYEEDDDDAVSEDHDDDVNHEEHDDDANNEEDDREPTVLTARHTRAISENNEEEQEKYFDAMEHQEEYFDAMEHQGDPGAAILREVETDTT